VFRARRTGVRTPIASTVVSDPTQHPLVGAQVVGDVLVLQLQRPNLNALSTELLAQLQVALQSVSGSMPRALLLWGGPTVFAAGADVHELSDGIAARRVGSQFRDTLEAIATFPRPTIAAIAGYALGGGCELAMACDFRVATQSSKLGMPEVLLGIVPGGGGTQRLPRLVGVPRAKELIFSGRHVSSDEALSIGLVDRVVPDDELQASALAWATELASGPTLALAMAKQAIDVGIDGSLSMGIALEHEFFVDVFSTDDSRIGIEAFKSNGPGNAVFGGT